MIRRSCPYVLSLLLLLSGGCRDEKRPEPVGGTHAELVESGARAARIAFLEVVLDRPEYRTGEEIDFTLPIRDNGDPVLGVDVEATLTTAPEPRPDGTFADGTRTLRDPDGDGNYTNTFTATQKAGYYEWTIDATLPGVFAYELHASAFVDVTIDPMATKILITKITDHPSGMRATRIAITPQDAKGEVLGPKRDYYFGWSLRNGTFEHVWKQTQAPLSADGTYERVVLFPSGGRPSLQVSVSGTILPAIDLRE